MNFYSPIFSPDGKKLFVVGEQRRVELVRYDSQSGQFATYLSGISAEGVSFSRDGKWLAYVDYPEGALWRQSVDGTEKLQLTFEPMLAGQPSWSPDRQRIAFAGVEPGKASKLYLVSAEGGSSEEFPTGEHNAGYPNWSGDGNSIYFSEWYWSDAGAVIASVKSLDLRTKQISTLPGSEGLLSVAGSPDGLYLSSMPASAQKLMLFDFKTRKWVELAKTDVGCQSWSADGRYLYFDSGLGKDPAVLRLRIADRQLERVVSLRNFRRAMGSSGWPWSGLTPDGSPLLMRNVGSQEVYALDWEAP